MKKRFCTRTAVMCVIASAALSLSGTAYGQTKITRIMAGTEYFQTQKGSQVMLPLPTGTVTVPLKGVPIKGMGNVDTEIQLASDVIFSSSDAAGEAVPDVAVSINVMALNLQGTFTGAGGQTCTVNITVGGASTGTATFTVNANQTSGNVSTSFTVNYVAVFSPSSCGPMITGKCTLNSKQAKWIAVPPNPTPTDPPYYLVTFPYPNPLANLHTAGSYPPGYVDIFITGVSSDAGRTAKHIVCLAASQVGGACPK